MIAWRQYAVRGSLYGVGLIGVLVTLAAMYGRVSPDGGAGFVFGGALLTAVAFGAYQYRKDARQSDERQMQINYRSAYVAFWVVYWVLFLYLMGTLGVDGGRFYADTGTVVAFLWGLATVVGIAARLWYKRKY